MNKRRGMGKWQGGAATAHGRPGAVPAAPEVTRNYFCNKQEALAQPYPAEASTPQQQGRRLRRAHPPGSGGELSTASTRNTRHGTLGYGLVVGRDQAGPGQISARAPVFTLVPAPSTLRPPCALRQLLYRILRIQRTHFPHA
jgi:hypothetical protein